MGKLLSPKLSLQLGLQVLVQSVGQRTPSVALSLGLSARTEQLLQNLRVELTSRASRTPLEVSQQLQLSTPQRCSICV